MVNQFLQAAAMAVYLLFAGVGNQAKADASMQQPVGKVVLTVGGAISNTTDGKQALFDLEQLKALGKEEIRTSTPWTNGEVTFEGIPLTKLLSAVGPKGGSISVTALNDYSANMTVAQLVGAGAILAYAVDGKPLSVRDKGPFWIIFPFDTDAKYRNDDYWSKSVWQVKSMTLQ
ncbi:molybdopterin-dependent oxidoreductase [Lacibacterium aquatile]|uniref:Molybdopterin-dependent oxidoreductase n=1 Tax=Lacibacterium aquatile TaxID=1168082 RepID=A0ABW5DUI7_9PROT